MVNTAGAFWYNSAIPDYLNTMDGEMIVNIGCGVIESKY